MPNVFLLCLLCIMSWSPLPGSLQEVQDDTDIPDTAFIELVHYVRSSPELDESVETRVEHAAIVDTPGEYRGRWITISGRLEQQRVLGRPFKDVQEWFIREEGGAHWAVYVVGTDAGFAEDGQGVTIAGFVYKRLRLVDRLGNDQVYPALVGANPVLTLLPGSQPAGGFTRLWVMLLILVVILVAVLLLARRSARRTPARPAIVEEEDETQPPLPEDPSEAMRELKRRGDDEAI